MSFRILKPLLVCALAGLAAQVALAQAKVGVVNVQKCLIDTDEIKKADADMQATVVKPRQDQMEKLQTEMQQIQTRLQTDQSLTQQAGMDLTAQENRDKTELTRLQEDLQNDVNEKRQEVLGKASERMAALIKKLAEEKGLDLVVDTQVALYFKPAMDLTAEATAAYNKAYPAAAAAPAPPKK